MLPYAFWDSSASKIIREPYEKHFDMVVNNDTMRGYNVNMENIIKDCICAELGGQIVNIVFDIGSKHGRSFLGVSVQFMVGIDIKIIHLGMVVLTKRNTSKDIESRIYDIQADFDVAVDQVHSLNTDNGTNVIRTQKDMLQAIAKCAAESLKKIEKIVARKNLLRLKKPMSGQCQLLKDLKCVKIIVNVIEGEIRSALDEVDQEIVDEKEQCMLLGESFAAEVLGDTAEEVDPEVWEDITENDLTIRVEKEVQVQLP